MALLPARRAPLPAARIQPRGYAIATSAIVLLFAALQTAHILRQFNSPSTLEAHTALAGLRTLDGYGWSDGYLRSLSGSLIWPVLSGSAFDRWGTAGPRILALLLVVSGFLALLSATRALFGAEAAACTALLLALSAPFWILAHIGSMEALALAAGCLAFWAITRLARDDHRGWLLMASAMLSLAMLAHYRAVILLIPASMLLAALRHRRAGIDIGLLWLISGLALVIYFDIFAAQIAAALSFQTVFGPSGESGVFDTATVTRTVVAIWGGVPLLIGFATWLRNRSQRRVIAAFLAGPAIWIGYWLLDARAGTALIQLDLALGTVLLYPVLGLALARVARDPPRLIALGILALGLALLSLHQTRTFDRGWPDATEPVAALVNAMQPGERALANERWPYALALYQAGRIEEPDDVLDETLLFGSDVVFDFCNFSWFVDSTPIDPWSLLVTTGIHSCGTFEPLLTASSPVFISGASLRGSETTVRTTVQRNGQPFQEPS